jgi:hypothetical protein
MAQPRKAGAERGEDEGRAIAVLNIRRVDDDGDQQAQRVGQI